MIKKGTKQTKEYIKTKADARRRIKPLLLCPTCKLYFEVYPCGFNNRTFCSRKCKRLSDISKRKISESNCGKLSNRKGKTFVQLYGIKKAMEIKEKISKSKTGHKLPRLSLQSRINHSLSRTKKKVFTGFTHNLNLRIRQLYEYKKWRLSIFTRDKFTCQYCKISGKYLHAHHNCTLSYLITKNNIQTIEHAYNCDELWDIANGITLCKECHAKLHRDNFSTIR